jgi:hypothetical protein
MDIPGTVQRKIIDDIVISFPEEPINAAVGCRKDTRSIKLPKEISPGPYKLETAVTYHPNPLRTVVIRSTSNTFNVTKSAE